MRGFGLFLRSRKFTHQRKQTMNTQTNSILASTVIANLAAQTTLGITWPADAEFCLASKTTTWPCGWDKYTYVEFFNSREELEAAIAHKNDWALCEDNDYAMRVYGWDWGPQHLPEYDRQSYQVPTKIYTEEDQWRVSTGQGNEESNRQNQLRSLYAQHAAIVKTATPKLVVEISEIPEKDDGNNYWY